MSAVVIFHAAYQRTSLVDGAEVRLFDKVAANPIPAIEKCGLLAGMNPAATFAAGVAGKRRKRHA